MDLNEQQCASTDNGFIIEKLGEYQNIKERKKPMYERKWRATCTYRASENIAKRALFYPCMRFEFFGAKWLHLK